MPVVKQGYKFVKTDFGKFEKIPKDWELKKLSEIGKIIGGGTPDSTESKYWRGDVLWAVPSDITKLKTNFIETTERTITKEGLKNSSAKLLPPGTVLITTRATIGDIAITKNEMATNQGFQNLICNENNDNLFWAYGIQFNKKKLMRLAYGTTFLEISKSEMKKISISSPTSRKEQGKIATILSNVDQMILSIQRILNETKKLKQGLMMEFLIKGIGHKKFKKVKWLFDKEIEIPEEWKITELNQVSKIVDSLHITPNYSSNGIPMVRSTDVKYGDLKLDKTLRVTKEIYNDFTKNHKPQKNDIVMSRVGTYFVTSFVNTYEQFCIGQNTLIIHPKIDPNFLYYFLNSVIVNKQIEFLYDRTSGQKTMSIKNIKKLLIFVPSLQEQKQIALILQIIHNKISNLEKKKTQLDILKMGLMQKLLTGQIRVTV